MRDKTFNSVLFPAPFRPITPTTSPRLISKETSFNAQNGSSLACLRAPVFLKNPASVSRKVLYRSDFPPMRNIFPRFSTLIAISLISQKQKVENGKQKSFFSKAESGNWKNRKRKVESRNHQASPKAESGKQKSMIRLFLWF